MKTGNRPTSRLLIKYNEDMSGKIPILVPEK